MDKTRIRSLAAVAGALLLATEASAAGMKPIRIHDGTHFVLPSCQGRRGRPGAAFLSELT